MLINMLYKINLKEYNPSYTYFAEVEIDQDPHNYLFDTFLLKGRYSALHTYDEALELHTQLVRTCYLQDKLEATAKRRPFNHMNTKPFDGPRALLTSPYGQFKLALSKTLIQDPYPYTRVQSVSPTQLTYVDNSDVVPLIDNLMFPTIELKPYKLL